MFSFTRQVQIATDFAKGVSARLAELEVPGHNQMLIWHSGNILEYDHQPYPPPAYRHT